MNAGWDYWRRSAKTWETPTADSPLNFSVDNPTGNERRATLFSQTLMAMLRLVRSLVGTAVTQGTAKKCQKNGGTHENIWEHMEKLRFDEELQLWLGITWNQSINQWNITSSGYHDPSNGFFTKPAEISRPETRLEGHLWLFWHIHCISMCHFWQTNKEYVYSMAREDTYL